MRNEKETRSREKEIIKKIELDGDKNIAKSKIISIVIQKLL